MWGWILWGLSIVVNILTAPKIPKDKNTQPDLKEFTMPTAEEGRAIPVIFGKQKITGSNVIWWGDLGFNGSDYQAGIHQIYCLSPIDRITAIWDGDKKYTVDYVINTIASGVLTKVGSYRGDLYVEFGELDQEVNAYLDYYSANTSETTNPLYRQTDYIPSYRGFFGTIFQGHLYQSGSDPALGTSPTPQSLSVELTRIERQSDFSEQWLIEKATVGSNGAMNPVHIIREELTSKVWGLGIEEARIGDSFQSYAVLAFNEGYGLGITLDRGSVEVNDFIQQICKYIDGFVYPDNNGVYQIMLARDNYDSDDLTVFDEDDYLEIKSFTRGTPFQMTNQIALTYTDPTTWSKKTIYAHDLAAIHKQGSVISTSINREWVLDIELARKMAAYELRKATSQLAKCTIIGNRSFGVLNPGDVFKLSNADLGLVNIIFRVLKIDRGEYENNKVELQVIEDVFAVGQGLYAPPNSTDYDAALNDPLESSNVLVDELPYWIAKKEYSAPTTDYGYIMTLQTRPSSECLYYQQWKYVGAYTQYEDGNFAYHNTLLNSLGYTTEADIPLTYNIDTEITYGAGTYIIVQNTSYGNYEIMELISFDTTAKTMTVKRGCMDTVPQYHPADSDVWFANMTANRGVILTAFANGSHKVKLLNQTDLGGVLLTDAEEITKVLAKRYMLPYRPKNVKVNTVGIDNLGFIFTSEGDYSDTAITWKHATRLETTTLYDAYDDTAETPEANQEYTVIIKDYLGATLQTYTGITTEGKTYTAAQEITDTGGGYTSKTIIIQTNRSAYNSFQTWTLNIVRMGVPVVTREASTSNRHKVGQTLNSLVLTDNFLKVYYTSTADYDTPPSDPNLNSQVSNQNTWFGVAYKTVYGVKFAWFFYRLYHPSTGFSSLHQYCLAPVVGDLTGTAARIIQPVTYFYNNTYYTYTTDGSVPAEPTNTDDLVENDMTKYLGSGYRVKAKGIRGSYYTNTAYYIP